MLLRTTVLLVLCIMAAGAEKESPVARVQELQQKAERATERDQSHLYAEVVRGLVEVIDQQLNTNQLDKVPQSMKDAVAYAEKCRAAAHKSNHKLKEAEISLRKAERRLDDLGHTVAADDRPQFKAAVDRISAVRTEILQLMFKR
jgi:hypothetical protein